MEANKKASKSQGQAFGVETVMNAHIKAIAEAEKVSFISLENAKLWNPEATKAASEFAYNMGLKIRKPLRDVAEILYSYAYNNVVEIDHSANKTA